MAATPSPEPAWTPAFRLDELSLGRPRVFKSGGRQLAVVRPAEGAVYAVDNRCPHEGYPLAQGVVVGGSVLMCCWHNFAFELRTGRCVSGDEDVRSYPTRIVDGRVEIDLADPDPLSRADGVFASLEGALLERKLGQAARDVVRLLEAGVPPEEVTARIVAFDAARGEFGPDHAFPVAADALPLLARHPGVKAALPIMLVADVATESNAGRPRREFPEPIDPGDDPEAAGRRLVEAAEAFRLPEVEALVHGALARGWGRDVLEPWLFRLASRHFLAFGHGLIFQVKTFDLLDRIGWQHAGALLPPLAWVIGAMPREERIPTHAGFRKRLDALEAELPAWVEKQGAGTLDAGARSAIRTGVLDGSLDEALDAVADALRAGAPGDAVAGVLSIAAAERLLRFDLEVDADPGVQEGWLDETHLITYANAVRTGLRRHGDADALRGLLFAAWFIHRMQPLDQPPERRPDPCAGGGGAPPTLEEVTAAVGSRAGDRAVALAARYLRGGGDARALRTALEDLSLGDHGTRPIFVAHFLKTSVAAFEEWDALAGDPDRDLLPLAAVRFLATPIAERRVASLTEDAIRFVRDGRPPRRLTP